MGRGTREALLCGAAALALSAAAHGATPSLAFDPTKPVVFEADSATYDDNGKTVTIAGHVQLLSDDRILTADQVIYDQSTGRVFAVGHVVVRQSDGAVLTAERVELTGDLKNGVIEKIGVIFDKHTRLAAARGTRINGTVTTAERAVFSPCDICVEKGEHDPLWQIKADTVTWDESDHTISYKNATFEFYGTPLLTVPAFSHPDFSTPNHTGFLTPSIGHSSALGYFAEIPYMYVLDPSEDVIVSPLFATSASPVMIGEFRQRTSSGEYFISGSYTYNREYDTNGNKTDSKTSFSHIFSRGRFAISDSIGWGFDIERVSNDTYLERYDISDADRLTSRAYIEWRDGRSYAALSAYSFQGLRATDDPGLTPIVLPEAIVHFALPDAFAGGELALDGNFVTLSRSKGLDTTRLSTGVTWTRPEIYPGGQSVTYFGTLRSDVYRIGDPNALLDREAKDGDILGRWTAYAGVDVRWPFVRQTEGGSIQIVEPIVQLVVAPYGNGPNGIPNEDSSSLEFDETNLFDPIKFTGNDLIETGPRANVGVRFAQYFSGGAVLDALAGFEARLKRDLDFDPETGLGDTQSDYVSSVSFSPWKGLTLTNRLRLDKDDFSVRRNEFYVQGTGSFYEIDASYLKLASDPAQIDLAIPREEVSLSSRVYVSKYWSFFVGARRDLESDKEIENRLAVAYEDECAFLELGFRRDYTNDRDVKPSTSVLFSIRLKALGEDDHTIAPLVRRDPSSGSENRSSTGFGSF